MLPEMLLDPAKLAKSFKLQAITIQPESLM